MIELHRLPAGSRFIFQGERYRLVNLDGRYSYCRDSKGEVAHIDALAMVEPVKLCDCDDKDYL